LHPRTRHTPETIRNLPRTVQLGLHPDALDHPEEYDNLCAEQRQKICTLVGRPMRIVRNHGFLNRDYLGHLQPWEENGLKLDVNYPGLDGTALNGSFLPMRVRRADGTWSEHYSLLTLFGDGMLYALQLTPEKAVERIKNIAKQIEASHPGVIVLNFHPENIADTRNLHREVLTIARRSGWIALGLEDYLEWLEILENLHIQTLGSNRFRMISPVEVNGLVLRFPVRKDCCRRKLPSWSGQIEVSFP